MDFRRSGQRDERRRRVLLEETGVEAATEAAQDAPETAALHRNATHPVPHYPATALSPRQPRVIDLIPKRRWTNLVIFVLALAAAAALEGAYGYVALRHVPADLSQYPAIDLAERGSVATWLTAALLGVSAVLGVLTYEIRRYRVDDYRGRYRMWYWMVPVLIIASVDSVAGIQSSVRTALLEAAGIPDYADALLVWVASLAVVVGAIALRLAIEMRACRLAICCLLAAVSCFAAIGVMELSWILPGQGVFQTMVHSGLAMGGHIALLMAMCLYARYVYRDACGEIVARPVRARTGSKRSRKGASGGSDLSASSSTRRHKEKVLRKDPPHTPRAEGAAQATRGATKTAETPSASGTSRRQAKRHAVSGASGGERSATGTLCTPDDDHVEQSRKLSKAERKRLRKLRRREAG